MFNFLNKRLNLLVSLFLGSVQLMQAAQIGKSSEVNWFDQAIRFWAFEDSSMLVILLGILLIGTNCGLIGGYIVTRRLSMFGDTLSHAVLPGIAVGGFISQSRNEWALMLGAILSGFLGVAMISFLTKFTKMRADSSMALILSAFYAMGISLIALLQQTHGSGAANLENYIFGSLVGLSQSDLAPIFFCLICVVMTFTVLHRKLLTTGFDPSFARSIGLPVELIHFFTWVLLAFCIVSSLQATGIILVSALLIIPASTAWLLTHRMTYLLILAAIIGALCGFLGCFISFLNNHLPTGPTIVLCSTFVFFSVLFFNPLRGIVPSWIKSRRLGQKIRWENTLKACYQVLEDSHFAEECFSQTSLARRRRKSNGEVEKEVDALIRQGYATRTHEPSTQSEELISESVIALTPSGWEVACRIVRNHRLWELYLTREASYAPDHVHDDAEKIEHIIGEKTVRRLERILSNPKLDPHGKPIPSQNDIDRGWISSSQAVAQ